MHKKYRDKLKNRPVKICVSCNKPIINPKHYKSDACSSGIKGVRSECQRLRDNVYKRSLPKSKKLRRRTEYKKPEGINLKYREKDQRLCLKCDGLFSSQSLHNRICIECKNSQPDIIHLRNISLETENVDELFTFAYQN